MSSAQPNTRPRRRAKSRDRGPAIVVEQSSESAPSWRNSLLKQSHSWMASFVVHLFLLIVLGFWFIPQIVDRQIAFQSGTSEGADTDSITVDLEDFDSDALTEQLQDSELLNDIQTDITDIQSTELPSAELSDFGEIFAAETLGVPEAGEVSGGSALSGRSADGRKRALSDGATAESENSVNLALAWIVRHQLPDGGWNFDHTVGPGEFRDTPGAGDFQAARNGATGLALLPLLGAGITHQTGEYKDSVNKGLEYLKRHAGGRSNSAQLSYADQDGRLYSHGIATIALCEAYALTRDEDLRPYAQAAVKFSEYAQDPRPQGGGWRYFPREPGDTSAVGWQLIGLKSAKLSDLEVDPRTFKRANKFLDSVSNSDGSEYGYLTNRRSPRDKGLNAVGLLCRMYLGWPKDRPGLVRGMASIAEIGPDTDGSIDMYYNYYATQAMKHMHVGKPAWTRWNTEMRDFLVDCQNRDGDTRGSWHFDSHWAQAGGRLYCTAMACMTLEVYYRFLPIYGKEATADDGFKLFEGS